MSIKSELIGKLDWLFDMGMCYEHEKEQDKFHDACINKTYQAILAEVERLIDDSAYGYLHSGKGCKCDSCNLTNARNEILKEIKSKLHSEKI